MRKIEMAPLTAEEFAPDFPEYELIVYRNQILNIECLIAVPKAKLRKLAANGCPPPFWRHGEVMDVRTPK